MAEGEKFNSNNTTNEELQSLLMKYKEETDDTAKMRLRNVIVIACMPLVKKISRGLARRNTDPVEDIIQVGSLGLIKAIDFYNPGIGKNFRTYASYLITGEIRHYLRDKVAMIKAPREIQELAFRVNQIANELAQQYGEKPTDEQLANILQMPVKKVNQVFEMERRKNTVSLDEMINFGDDDKQVLSERISDEDYYRSEAFQETKILLASALNRLPEEYKNIIEMNFFDDLSQREISNKLGISQMQVSRKIKKAISLLFEMLADTNDKKVEKNNIANQ